MLCQFDTIQLNFDLNLNLILKYSAVWLGFLVLLLYSFFVFLYIILICQSIFDFSYPNTKNLTVVFVWDDDCNDQIKIWIIRY